MKALLDRGLDAVFVGTGAPRGKNLEIPGRYDTDRHPHRHRLARVASRSATSTKIGERVLIIGVGNTAMDCCRTSRRLGGKDIKVMARRPRQYFKASPWELDDAEEEQVEIVINHAPKSLRHRERQAQGHGVRAARVVARTSGKLVADAASTTSSSPADAVILAIGQEDAFPWIERDIGIEFDKWGMPVVDKVTFE